MTKIAQMTNRYIAEHPTVKECLAKDLINYSKLSRKIAAKLKIKQVSAVIVACRRYAKQIKADKKESGLDLIKKSRKSIKIENKQAYVTFAVNENNLSEVLGVMK